MKKILLLISILFSVTVEAQKGYAEYGYIESLGLGNAKGLDYNAILFFTQKNSHYTTAKESLEKAEKINEQKIVQEDGQVTAVFNGMGVSKEGNQVFYSKADNIIFSILHFDKDIYYIKDSAIKINWEISSETKKIGNFTCTKATANFRGRDYTAWFTTDIPLPYGPWKLMGLPGLILEAYDTDKYVYWYFKNVEYPTTKVEESESQQKTASMQSVDYSVFKKKQKEYIKKTEEKNAIIMQQNSGVQITSPVLNEIFVECE